MSWWNPLTWFVGTGPICPKCKGPTSATSTICWACSQAGAGVLVHLDGLDRDDTIRDKEVEKAMFKARMKEMNRGKAG